MSRLAIGVVSSATCLLLCTTAAFAQTMQGGESQAQPDVPNMPGMPSGGGGAGGGMPGVDTLMQTMTRAAMSAAATSAGGGATGPSSLLGNVENESAAHAGAGGGMDTFDLVPKGGAGLTARGSSNGPIYLRDGVTSPDAAGQPQGPLTHQVQKGDTLWKICDTYLNNPYQWPRVWSYNPQILNPHWIRPGDMIHIEPPSAGGFGGIAGGYANGINAPGNHAVFLPGEMLPNGKRFVSPETVYLRDVGYIDDDSQANWGEFVGAPNDKTMLADTDNIYMRIAPGHDIKIGQELTIFRPFQTLGAGKLVAIQGTVLINEWNARDRVARGRIVETIDAIERSARVGPVGRNFSIVVPVRNTAEVKAHIVASVRPRDFYSQHAIVYIDKGDADGLRPGNRLFVTRHSDGWRDSLPNDAAATRLADDGDAVPQLETLPRPSIEKYFPEENFAELRVLTTRAHAAACLLTHTSGEIEMNEEAVAHKGY